MVHPRLFDQQSIGSDPPTRRSSGDPGAAVSVDDNLWLASLTVADREKLTSRLQPYELRLGDVVQTANEPVEWVYFPLSGLLSLVYTSAEGQTVETGMIGKEGGSGLLAACGVGRAFVNHLVQIEGQAVRAPASVCRSLYESSQTFRAALARQAELLLVEGRQSVVCQALHSAEARCARWLLESRDRAGCGETVPLTQEHLAAMLGVQRTTVSAVASELQRLGLIRYSRGRIGILDASGLERAACECRRVLRSFRRSIGEDA